MNTQISCRINNEGSLICDNIILRANPNKSLLRFSDQQNYDMTCSLYIDGIILSICITTKISEFSFRLSYS